jgi:hypothetical protein
MRRTKRLHEIIFCKKDGEIAQKAAHEAQFGTVFSYLSSGVNMAHRHNGYAYIIYVWHAGQGSRNSALKALPGAAEIVRERRKPFESDGNCPEAAETVRKRRRSFGSGGSCSGAAETNRNNIV